MKSDDGRLWALGALGVVAVVGLLDARRGGANGERKFIELVEFGGVPEDRLWFGAGILYEEDGKLWVEAWDGLDASMTEEALDRIRQELGREPEDEDVERMVEMPVVRLDVPENVILSEGWIDWPDLAHWSNRDERELRREAASDDPLVRGRAFTLAVAWQFFDEKMGNKAHPNVTQYTADALLDRWPLLLGTVERRSFRGITVVPRSKAHRGYYR